MVDGLQLVCPGLSRFATLGALQLVGGNNSVVECDLAKVEVAGSNPVSRSILRSRNFGDASYGWQAHHRPFDSGFSGCC